MTLAGIPQATADSATRHTESGGRPSPPVPWRSARLSPSRAFLLPLVAAVGLAGLTILPPVQPNPVLFRSFIGAAAILALWNGALFLQAARTGRILTLDVVVLKQHYLQACAQGSVLLYWGWYWREVYQSAHLIAAQLVFAYGFDMLLSWSRRDKYTLGFGPFPVIFSINLFLWFKPDWFYLQFVLVAVGFAAKELIRWEKDGRAAHIFNPSSFPLAVFSIALILTGTSELAWGNEIANTQFYPPHMYLWIFLIGLPGQYFFGVTTMTMSAVLTTYLFGLAYFAATGVYFFYDSYIPIAVFLGMHLLFTDPSTSPRSELGRIIFGVLYGLSTVVLYQVLGVLGLPTFYDKLLQVPLLNLSIKAIERAARSPWLRPFDPAAIGRSLRPRQRHLAYITVWAAAFVVLSSVQGVGDAHRGQWLPFWRQACDEDRPFACSYLADLEAQFCNRGSGWACNESGILQAELGADLDVAAESIQEGCALGFATACENMERLAAGLGTFKVGPPELDDLPIVLQGAKGPITDTSPEALYALACRQGWPGACERTAQRTGN
jgi:hypothetical protein